MWEKNLWFAFFAVFRDGNRRLSGGDECYEDVLDHGCFAWGVLRRVAWNTSSCCLVINTYGVWVNDQKANANITSLPNYAIDRFVPKCQLS